MVDLQWKLEDTLKLAAEVSRKECLIRWETMSISQYESESYWRLFGLECGQLWDDVLAEEDQSIFLEWVSELQQLTETKLEQNFTTKHEVVEVHI